MFFDIKVALISQNFHTKMKKYFSYLDGKLTNKFTKPIVQK